jgi:hypothetical protein
LRRKSRRPVTARSAMKAFMRRLGESPAHSYRSVASSRREATFNATGPSARSGVVVHRGVDHCSTRHKQMSARQPFCHTEICKTAILSKIAFVSLWYSYLNFNLRVQYTTPFYSLDRKMLLYCNIYDSSIRKKIFNKWFNDGYILIKDALNIQRIVRCTYVHVRDTRLKIARCRLHFRF